MRPAPGCHYHMATLHRASARGASKRESDCRNAVHLSSPRLYKWFPIFSNRGYAVPKPPLAAASSQSPLTRGTPGPITQRPTGACNHWLAAHRIPLYCPGHLCTWPLGFECLWYQLGLFPFLVKQGLVGRTVSHRNGRTKGDQRYMYSPDLLCLKRKI